MADLTYDDIMSKDILELLGLTNLSEEEKKNLQTVMEETIKNRIIARVVDALSEPELTEWTAIPEEQTDARLKFFEDHKVNLQQFALEEALIYKYELTNLIDTMRTQARKNDADSQP